MYETYFNLTQRPFVAVPRPDHYFAAASADEARKTLTRCIDRGEGTGILVGPTGTGKTLLCHVLAEQFQETFRVALLAGTPLCSRRALLQAILYELSQPYRKMDEGELRLALTDFVTCNKKCSRGIVLLIDEAHHLSLRVMDEIHTLTNLSRENQPAVRLILAGGRALEERFTSPRLESFSQRLAARCYLEAFTRQETQEYLHARFAACGGRGAMIFPPETCQTVHKVTEGVPRLINQVCDHVMLLAYAGGQHQIDPQHIEEAWADLQQLPAPAIAEATTTTGGVIEFGGLDDEPSAATEAAALGAVVESAQPEPEAASAVETGELGLDEQVRHIQEILADVETEFRPAGTMGPEVELTFDDSPFREEFAEEEKVADRYTAPAASARLPGVTDKPTPTREDELAADDGLPPTVPMRRDTAATWMPAAAGQTADGSEEDERLPWPARSIAAVQRQEFGRLFAGLRKRG